MNDRTLVSGIVVSFIVEIVPPACMADLDGSGTVDLADLLSCLAVFGTASPGGDVDGDGVVDLGDLLALLAEFGSGC